MKQDERGDTALHCASQRSHLEMVRILVANGTAERLEKVDKDGFTALHHAVWRRNLEIARLLVDKNPGLIAKQTNKYGKTALNLSRDADMAKMLLDANADMYIRDKHRRTARMRRWRNDDSMWH
jgi:ankyrin repeat protein